MRLKEAAETARGSTGPALGGFRDHPAVCIHNGGMGRKTVKETPEILSNE
jgi:hypothetical protein